MKGQYFKLRLLFMVACLCCLFSIVSFAEDYSVYSNSNILNVSYNVTNFSTSTMHDVGFAPVSFTYNSTSDSPLRTINLTGIKAISKPFDIVVYCDTSTYSYLRNTSNTKANISDTVLPRDVSSGSILIHVPESYNFDNILVFFNRNTSDLNFAVDSDSISGSILSRSGVLLVWFSTLFTMITNFIISNKLTVIFVSLFFVGAVIGFLTRIYNNV